MLEPHACNVGWNHTQTWTLGDAAQNEDFDKVPNDHDDDDGHRQAVNPFAQNQNTNTQHNGHDKDHGLAMTLDYGCDESHDQSVNVYVPFDTDEHSRDDDHSPAETTSDV